MCLLPYIYKIVSKETWNYNTGLGLETFSEIIMLFLVKQVSKDNYTNKGFFLSSNLANKFRRYRMDACSFQLCAINDSGLRII